MAFQVEDFDHDDITISPSTCQNPLTNAYVCALATPLWVKCAVAALLGLGIVVFAVLQWRKRSRRHGSSGRPSPWVKNYQPGMVYLFQFQRTSLLPSMSPFCLKLETWLRMAGIPYRNVENLPSWIRSREGTLPFVEVDGVEYPDSTLAIIDLSAKFSKTLLHHMEKHQQHMSGEEKAAARGLEMLVEGSLLPASAYFRMPYARQLFTSFQPPGTMPGWMVPFVVRWWKTYLARRLYVIGISKHSPENVRRIAEGDLLALSAYLAEKPYFTGKEPTKLDAMAFAALVQIIQLPFDTPPKRFIEERCANLRDFCERVKTRYWPDWEECTAQYKMNTSSGGGTL